MLEDNVKAPAVVSEMSASDVRERVSGVFCAGSSAHPVTDDLFQADVVVAALDNADCSGGLAEVASLNPHGVAAGIIAVCKVCGAGSVLLVLPSDAGQEVSSPIVEAVGKAGFEVTVEVNNMVSAHAHERDVKVHLVTLAAMADALVGSGPQAVVVTADGLACVPFGTSLRDVVPAADACFLCVNHTLYPATILDEPLPATLALGDGTIRAYGEDDCVVQAVCEQVGVLREKSCGTCTFCREGLYQLETTFKAVTLARGKASDLDVARELCEAMPHSTLCSLGQVACHPAQSALDMFADEVEAHLRKKTCPSGACKAFLKYYVDPSLCEGCGDCIDACPQGCIDGRDGFISMIDEFGCDSCGACLEACPEGAIKRVEGRTPPLPERLTRVGRFRRR
ncbi:MAG: NADH-ubiquinone oxidoreductase-F iron-sulfur binding region domain-containing protein [Atopobiaceae bacterium]|nr:NADH-ubiquinone oxidoreductase-F iron-sulfur binding region domain-containing protein [Atopobiaceae bacterium]